MLKAIATAGILISLIAGGAAVAPTYQAHETKVYNTYDTEFAELISNINH